MLTVEDYGRIRRAHRDGMSIRAIARTFHHSRRKIREVLANPEPRPYSRAKDPPAPVLGRVKPIIDEILSADEQAPRKQRHTAAQIHRRLQAEHNYAGGYDQVRRYVARKRRSQRETFIPLARDPGQRLEADFGHIYVDFPEGRRQVPVLITVWSHSNCPFAMAMPTERIEVILAGMVEAFAFFACVPREVWWDNPATVVTLILKGRDRKPHDRYEALASHYRFDPLFCMPARGNEKPYAENRVYSLQRRWATPVPRVKDFDELNAYLRDRCLKDRERTVAQSNETVSQRFERDRAAALPLPDRRFDPCIRKEAKVNKYQTVRFDNNGYSVPRPYAFQNVTVKGYIDHIEVVADGRVIARHDRCYGRGEQILDPIHYLVTLERRPAALDHADVYRHWQLPAAFAELRQRLEQRHGTRPGARQYIQVLQLLAHHPVRRVQRAIENGRPREYPRADAIIRETHRLAQREAPSGDSVERADQPSHVSRVQVPRPDLSRFDQLLSTGVLTHV